MSYFEFFSKNISKPIETTKSATNPQDEHSDNAVIRSTEGKNRTTTPKDALPAKTTYRPSGQNNGSRRATRPLYKPPAFRQETAKIYKPAIIETSVSTETINGTCLTMCPEDEVLMREEAKMVHVLEVMDNKRMLVKCFSRSAADSKMAVPRLLRPYKTLQDTVRHLLFRVTAVKDTSPNIVYDFLCDRLRAVRQDMTVQRLPPADCITLLEPMIRFHVYFGYILCEHPITVYDPVLNKKLLLECLKWFLSCCDSIDQSPSDLNSEMSQLNLNSNLPNKSQRGLKLDTACDRVLMESLYVLCNLDDVHPMYRYWGLPTHLKSNPAIKLAYKIAVANLRGNYVEVCKQVDTLCPLAYCALCLYLPTLQRRALLVMSAAYNSKQLTVPLSAVRRWLRFDSDAEAARVCAHYGLRPAADTLRFARGDFKLDVAMHQPSRPILLDQNKDLSMKHVFTYTSKDY